VLSAPPASSAPWTPVATPSLGLLLLVLLVLLLLLVLRLLLLVLRLLLLVLRLLRFEAVLWARPPATSARPGSATATAAPSRPAPPALQVAALESTISPATPTTAAAATALHETEWRKNAQVDVALCVGLLHHTVQHVTEGDEIIRLPSSHKAEEGRLPFFAQLSKQLPGGFVATHDDPVIGT